MALVFEGIQKVYPNGFRAVNHLDLEVKDGEFFTLLGPSGCGKTTTLRMIAGLETPSAGKVFIGGRDFTRTHPRDRDVAMVFQSYALYPHMTVREKPGPEPQGPEGRRRRDRATAAGSVAHAGHRAVARQQAGAAFGRPAPAHRARPGR